MINVSDKHIVDKISLTKRIIQVVFFIVLAGITVWLILHYKQNVSRFTFYHFLIMIGIFVTVDILFHIKYKDNKIFLKFLDLFAAIILGVLTYIFAINTLR